MNKREAHVWALRYIAQIAESSIGAGFEPTGTEEDDELVFAAMRQICTQERRRPVCELPFVEYR